MQIKNNNISITEISNSDIIKIFIKNFKTIIFEVYHSDM